jgi:hypothetical protein
MGTFDSNAMHDEIRDGVRAGIIPREWRRADIRPHLRGRGYLDNSITTMPSNYAISKDGKTKGNYVKRGMQPKYLCLEKGLYRLIDE